MRVKLSLSGDADLVAKLEKIGKRMGRAVQMKALRAGSTPVLQAFRAASPVGKTGNLKRGQTRKLKTYASGISVAIVGADYAVAPHAHLVEYGTKERYRKKFAQKTGRGFTGHAKGQRVFTKAFEAVKGAAESAMTNTLATELETALGAL